MNRLFICCLGIVVAVLAPSRSLAGVIRHDVPPAAHLVLGSLSIFDAVGKIDATSPTGGFSCSGTLIDPEWVLTAGHCVEPPVASSAPPTSIDFTVGGVTVAADVWAAHPGWLPDNLLNLIIGHDIGLLHLSSSVTHVAPATRLRGVAEVGRTAFYTGFGQTGTGLTGAVTSDGLMRAGTNDIDSYFFGDVATSRVFLSDFDNPLDPSDSFTGSTTPNPFEFMIAPGDSGGGAFVWDDSQWLLAGVNSFTLGIDFDFVVSDYGDASGATRVRLYNEWLDAVIALTSAGQLGASDAVELSNERRAIVEASILSELNERNLLQFDAGLLRSASRQVGFVPEPKIELLLGFVIGLSPLFRQRLGK